MDYAVIDIEATGGKFNYERITEIAIYRYNGHEQTDKFISLVNPEMEIMPYVQNLTGINQKKIKNAPKFYQIAKRVNEITKDCIMVGHNINFDFRVLQKEFLSLGFNFNRNKLCTLKLSKKFFPNELYYSLKKISKSLGLILKKNHRAEDDALATLQLLKLLLSKDKEKRIVSKYIIKANEPLTIKKVLLNIIDRLPNDIGIYYIYNEYEDLIYIKAAKNIKDSVNRLFLFTDTLGSFVGKDANNIMFEITGNILIANLRANEEILINKPKYNTKLYEDTSDAKFSYPAKDIVIILEGKVINNQSVILISDGYFKGVGIISFNFQLKKETLEQIITPMKSTKQALKLIERYLKENDVLKIKEL